MSEKKKIQILILILMVVLIALLVVACNFIKGCFGPGEPTQPSTEPSVVTTAPTEVTTEPTTEPTTAPTTTPTTAPTTAPTTQTTGETTEPSSEPVYVPPETEPPTEPAPTEPQVTDPEQILALAKEQLRNLSGDANEVGSVDNAKYLTITVSGKDDVQTAAQIIVGKVKDTLAYEQSQADPNVAVGNPKPFTYDYNLTFVETVGDLHTFQFAYHFVSTSYEVSDQNYDTNRLVADVCAYLDSLGKVKFDSMSSDYAASQPVIVLPEHPYETALSIVKAQVESASAQYRNYDFYYAALTVTTKGGVEQEALLFYIVNK